MSKVSKNDEMNINYKKVDRGKDIWPEHQKKNERKNTTD